MIPEAIFFLQTLVGAIIFGISAIHFYWVFGGKWGLSVALPEPVGQSKSFPKPGPFLTILVALAFLLMSLIVFGAQILPFSENQIYYLRIAIGIVFLLRSIGDFKYFGFFRKIKSTNFSKFDTQFFTPLSFFIGFVLILISLLK